MYREQDVVDLFWSTFFNLKEKEIVELSKKIKAQTAENYIRQELFRHLETHKIFPNDENYIKACESAALRFCLEDSDFAREFLADEIYEKALDQFKRKQFTSKPCKELLAKFNTLLNHIRYSTEGGLEKLRLILRQDITRAYKAFRDEEVNKSFYELKKKIEVIASGVKSKCYLDAEKGRFNRIENNELTDFVKNKYGYDLSENNELDLEQCKSIYNSALLDSEKFWAEHKNFNIFTFINAIYELNGEKHAQKVLSHIFDNIKSDEIGAKLLESNLSLEFMLKERYVELLKNTMFNIPFGRFKEVYDLSKIKDEVLCYPLVTVDDIDKRIAAGKEVIEGLFNTIYPADSAEVIKFFNRQLTGEEEPYYISKNYSVKDLFINYTFANWYDGRSPYNYRATEIYCPEYFSPENIWNRIYLTGYAASKLEKDRQKCYANLFEVYYDFFKVIEKKFGLKTSYQKNIEGRDKAYLELKEILKNFGVNISDNFKQDYIISLLDRKVAVIEEIMRFPVLEQLGDAVYGFALAEMMFYQPAGYEEESIIKDFAKYVCAEAQVEIANMLWLDKLYISSLSLSYKFRRDIWVNPDNDEFLLRKEISDHDCKLKFLADSLEMIIGTICKDCGYQTAIDFTKRIIKQKYPDVFKQELHFAVEMEIDPELDIDGAFWDRTMPTLLQEYYYQSSTWYNGTMWYALNKFMLAYSLGTNDLEKRKFITNRHSQAKDGDELYGKNRLGQFTVNYAMYEYLHKGLAFTIEKYSPRIMENYKKLKIK